MSNHSFMTPTPRALRAGRGEEYDPMTGELVKIRDHPGAGGRELGALVSGINSRSLNRDIFVTDTV